MGGSADTISLCGSNASEVGRRRCKVNCVAILREAACAAFNTATGGVPKTPIGNRTPVYSVDLPPRFALLKSQGVGFAHLRSSSLPRVHAYHAQAPHPFRLPRIAPIEPHPALPAQVVSAHPSAVRASARSATCIIQTPTTAENRTMAINDDVPREFDKIQVFYVLDNGERVWWPTTVLHSLEYSTPGAVKGTGTVEFAAFRNNKRSVQDVQFLAGRTVNTNNGEASWRTSAEAADAGDGDGDEASWERAVGKRGRAHRLDFHTTLVTDAPTDAGPGQSASDAHARTPKRRKDTTTTAPVVSRRDASASRRSSADNSGMDALMRRIAVLEERQANKCDHMPAYERFVEMTRVIWKARVLRALAKPMRKNTQTRSQPFGSVLFSNTMGFEDDFAYELFSHIVADVAKLAGPGDDGCVSFVPSFNALTDPEQDIAEGHVLFSSARAVLNWLGITSSCDVRRLVCRSQTQRDGVATTRVLGGLQRNKDNLEDPVRVFVGFSCAAHRRATDVLAGEDAGAVEFASGRWDASNNKFCAVPEATRCSVGEYSHERDCNSVFSLSWVWTGGYDGRAVSLHGKKTGYVRVGRIALKLPSVTFRGNDLCAQVDRLLSERYLEDCT